MNIILSQIWVISKDTNLSLDNIIRLFGILEEREEHLYIAHVDLQNILPLIQQGFIIHYDYTEHSNKYVLIPNIMLIRELFSKYEFKDVINVVTDNIHAVESWIDRYRNIFEELLGDDKHKSKGTSRSAVVQKMKVFLIKYPQYAAKGIEFILEVTRYGITQEINNLGKIYVRRADYFIQKIQEGVIYEDLLTYCEEFEKGKPIGNKPTYIKNI